MIKVKTTAQTYKSVVLKRAILICWVLLFICFALKLFGGNYFEIMVNSPNFVAVCQFVDNNIILYATIGIISSLISYYFFYLAILQKLKFSKREFWIYFISVVAFCILRVYTINSNYRTFISLFSNIIQCFIIPFALGVKFKKKSIFRLLIANILNFLFQFIAVITKNIGMNFITETSLVATIFMIDLDIMLVLYYLYSNNKNMKGE